MLPLDSDEWAELTNAYGIATDIPPLLRELASFPPKDSYRSEPYSSLWGNLCHQGDVYSASYAAVPHIVAILESAPERASEDFFHLPAQIELCRCKGCGPEIPGDLEKWYFDAFSKFPNLVAQAQTRELGEEYIRILSATTAVVGGQRELGEAILELEPRIVKRFMGWVESW